MKEIRSIINHYKAIIGTKKRMALATVVNVEGSSYRREGARMLVVEDGTWVGGISGGCLEGDALRKAKNAIVKGIPSIVRYDTRDDDVFQIGVGLGCNGVIDVLISPIINHRSNPIEILSRCMNKRQPSILLTSIGKSGNIPIGTMQEIVLNRQLKTTDNEEVNKKLEKEIGEVVLDKKSKIALLHGGKYEYKFFIEYLPPEMHLILYGANYDIYPLADIAKNIGWEVTVVCNPQKVDKALFTKVNVVSIKSNKIIFDKYTAAILMAHDYKTDKNNLCSIINSDVAYIGMLGPQVRSKKILNELRIKYSDKWPSDLTNIHAPIGLDTGATSPEEIAISIIAEIRTYFSKRSGGYLKDRIDTIHSR
ncbi:MAG: XdhC family protein [Saprospiraceae bacterium]